VKKKAFLAIFANISGKQPLRFRVIAESGPVVSSGKRMKQTIGNYASRPVYALDAEAKVRDALEIMSERRISCVIILTHDEPVGILTERDVVFAANWLFGQPGLLLKEVMNKPVMTASEEMSVYQAYRIFCQHRIRHLVVLDASLEMSGIFTQTDLVRSLREKIFAGIGDISRLMSPQVLRVAASVPARYALSLMARRSVSCVVVVDNDRPVGMFTERDVVRHLAKGVEFNAVPVGSLMTPKVVATPVSSLPFDTIGLMHRNSIRRLLVVDEFGEMRGILTQTDIGRVLDQQPVSLVSQLLGDPDPSWHRPSPYPAGE
jgi:CBS domain-containing protein